MTSDTPQDRLERINEGVNDDIEMLSIRECAQIMHISPKTIRRAMDLFTQTKGTCGLPFVVFERARKIRRPAIVLWLKREEEKSAYCGDYDFANAQ